MEDVQQLILDYAKRVTKSEQEANQFIFGLAQAVQEDGVKLVHFGKTLFLIIVRAEGVVEIHTMSVDEDSVTLAKNFVLLAKYLEMIGVKTAYTFTSDPKFAVIAKRTKLPFKTKNITLPDGGEAVAYFMEF